MNILEECLSIDKFSEIDEMSHHGMDNEVQSPYPTSPRSSDTLINRGTDRRLSQRLQIDVAG